MFNRRKMTTVKSFILVIYYTFGNLFYTTRRETTKMSNSGISDFDGYVSAIQVYAIWYWLEYRMKLIMYDSKIPKADKDYIINHFHLVYVKRKRRYMSENKDIFNIFKQDYPDIFEKEGIDSYEKLKYLAGM